MKPKVVIAKPIPKEVEEYIAKHCEYTIWEKKEPMPKEVLWKDLADAEGLMTGGGAITKELLDHAPNLKAVSFSAVGYDGFDLEAMKERNVLGTHTPYVLDETVADLAFALILSSARRITEANNLVKAGKWTKEMDGESIYGQDVHHATLGIIGMGRIGEKIVRRARLGFEMEVLYNSNSRKPELEEKYGIVYHDVDSLLQKSDFVMLIVPLTPSTHQMIGEREFNLMKPSAFLINCARGKVVDEQAMIKALEEGKIRGAGLDVFETEPVDPSNPLLKMDNVVAIPHIGSATHATRAEMAMKAAENLVAGVTGQVPPNVVKELQVLVKK